MMRVYIGLISILFLFALSCSSDTTGPDEERSPITGAIEISTQTNGPNQDPNGYTVDMHDGTEHSIGVSETIVVDELEEGNYHMSLEGTSANCFVDSPNPQGVQVAIGDTSSIAFDVSCLEGIENKILFMQSSGISSGDGELVLADPDGSNVSVLTDIPDQELFASISPEGARIAYVKGNSIYRLRSDGTDPVRLTMTAADNYPKWSPEGNQIAFSSIRDGNYEIYTAGDDGSNQENFTNSPDSEEQQPSWSPDGNRIAFYSDRDSDGDYEIYSLRIDGQDLQKLTDNDAKDSWPVYSPDGSRIAFVSERDGNPELYIMNADGSNQQRVTNHQAADEFPSWSPDGSRLVFQSTRESQQYEYEIYVINADGTNIQNITNSTEYERYPYWAK